jgi:hypothetical protein
MDKFFAIYAVCTAVILIRCSLNSEAMRLGYLSISSETLNKWVASGKGPLVFELHSKVTHQMHPTVFSGALKVTWVEFSSLVDWLPPHSVLVFHAAGGIRYFNCQLENKLMSLGIAAVFWLDDQSCSHGAAKVIQGTYR